MCIRDRDAGALIPLPPYGENPGYSKNPRATVQFVVIRIKFDKYIPLKPYPRHMFQAAFISLASSPAATTKKLVESITV